MHYCPECGQACYCHGDIDDCVVETEEYSSARCTHPQTAECEDDSDDDFWDPRDDDVDEEDLGYVFGPPPADQDDQELGPVADLFCTSCRRWTEHLVCESHGETTTYRCSQCYAAQTAVTQPISYDPKLHHEMTGEEGDDALPF